MEPHLHDHDQVLLDKLTYRFRDPKRYEVKDYSKDHTTDSCELKGKFHLSSDEYFVLGDNRDNSNDSRYKEVGPVKRSKITGRIIFRFYPWKNAGVIRP